MYDKNMIESAVVGYDGNNVSVNRWDGIPGLMKFNKILNTKFCNSIVSYFDNQDSFLNSKIISNKYYSELSLNNEWNVNIRSIIDELDKDLEKIMEHYYNWFIDADEHYSSSEIKERHFDLYNRCDKFSIRKYKINSKQPKPHHDFDNSPDNLFRQLSVIFYLNDVNKGGEELFQVDPDIDIAFIKPRIGDILIFPSNFPYIHTSKPSISDDKYVINTWITNFYQRYKPKNND